MPREAGPKLEREYEKLKHKFKQSGRYKGRAGRGGVADSQ